MARNASRLVPPRRCCWFHASAVLGAVALAARGIVHAKIGITAAFGFVIAAGLFRRRPDATALRRHGLFSDGRADGRDAADARAGWRWL